MLIRLVTQLILGYQVGIVTVFAIAICDNIKTHGPVLGKNI